MKKTLKVVLLSSLLPFAAMASEELSPWYVGGGLGVNNYEPSNNTTEDDDPFAWDVFAGYMFNDYFGAEIGYRDLGDTDWMSGTSKYDTGVAGSTLGLIAVYPFGNKWSLSAEAGAFLYNIDTDITAPTTFTQNEENGTAPYFGVGFGYNFTDNLKVQAKYRRYENLDDTKFSNLEMESNYWGLELSYRFSGAAAAVPVAAAVLAPVDSDNDGVTDDKDQCADTPSTHKVDAVGCTMYTEKVEKRDVGSIQFANNSSVVPQADYPRIEKLATYMNENPNATVMIAGHASNVGSPAYNMTLSEKRADAVAKILVNQYGVSSTRVTSKGFGVTQPLIEGSSREANIANRRIEAHVTGTMKEPVLK